MYNIGGWLNLLSPRGLRGVQAGVSRNVLLLGLTSLFTDISSEMVVSVLPIYLVTFLRLSPVQFGLIDGLYQGVAALVQLASGIVADRWRRHKEVAWVGYAGSAVSRLGLLATTAWTGIAGMLVVDRLGKGLRTAPRDALISLSVPREKLGTAFGIHRAMDAMGAMLGPILAFVILTALPGAFDVVFVTSFLVALIGLAVLGLFVENRAAVGEHSTRFNGRCGVATASDSRFPPPRHVHARAEPDDDERRVRVPRVAAAAELRCRVVSVALRADFARISSAGDPGWTDC